MSKSEVFEEQLKLIHNESLRNLTKIQLEKIPDYFYVTVASSTSKYHNQSENSEGGLVRHVKAVFKLANDLLNIEIFEPLLTHRDEILVAILLHDSIKKGLKESKYTVFEHPKLAADNFKETAIQENYGDMDSIDLICGMICSHSGQWNTNKYSNLVLPKPSNKLEAFVHMCDYLGSRNYINIDKLDDFS